MTHRLALPTESAPPDACVLLDLWLDNSSEDERDPIGIKGEPSYRYFWRTWIKYLDSCRNGAVPLPLAWHTVTPVDILGFLSAGPRGRKIDTNPSVITKRRYWRLLERIYAFAKENGWIESNPVAMLAITEVPPPEDPRGLILTPQVWEAALHLLSLNPGTQPLAIRNHAINRVLFDLALMPMEVRMLTLNSLVRQEVETGVWDLRALQLDGPGVGQMRKLVLDEALKDSLIAWLNVRSMVAKSADQTTLFCSRSRKPEPLTPMQLINIVTALIKQAAKACGQPLPPRLGPQIVRNTRLVMWLNDGIPPAQVAVWAGLKDARGLYHLRDHTNPEVQLPEKPT